MPSQLTFPDLYRYSSPPLLQPTAAETNSAIDQGPPTMQSSRAPPRPKALNWTPQSHLAVFVRNLQLLQLDQRDDWPGITVRSLSPTSQTQQRQRIKAVEWALYQLVTIWDLETARDVCLH